VGSLVKICDESSRNLAIERICHRHHRTGPCRHPHYPNLLVPPRDCQFTPDFQSVPLLERHGVVSRTSSILRFGSPNATKPINFPQTNQFSYLCLYILARASIIIAIDVDNNDVMEIRPTPISTNAQFGSFDLMVKKYGENGIMMSRHLCETIQVGDSIDFKHIKHYVKIQEYLHTARRYRCDAQYCMPFRKVLPLTANCVARQLL
jgi:hypothetical protein